MKRELLTSCLFAGMVLCCGGEALCAQQPTPPIPPRAPLPPRPGAGAPGAPVVPGNPAVPTVTNPPFTPPVNPAQPGPVVAPPAAAVNSDDVPILSMPASPLGDVLERYQQLIGKDIIRDPHLENAVVSIETSRPMKRAEAIEFIEKSLLLAGYAVVPSGEKMVKVIAFDAGHNPSSERVNMILRESELPKSDVIVTFLLPLQYLDSEKAAQAFLQIVPKHSYGNVIGVPNAHALMITENSNTIRAYIDLARQVDLPPSETKTKTIHLERADAEEVAKNIGELLGISSGSSSGSAGGSNRTPTRKTGGATAQARPASLPQGGQPTAPPPANAMLSMDTGESDAAAPKLQAIPRLNSILVIARPVDFEYIESLVKEFDAESKIRGFISRKLRYLDVIDFVNVAKDALLRGVNDGSSGDKGLTGTEQTKSTTTPSTQNNNNNYNSYGGSNGLFGGGGSGFSGFSGGASLQETQMAKTQSLLIGKTVLIVEPSAGSFYASGPPDQLKMLETLADELDTRPQQVIISCIVGSLTLTHDFQFGLDWVRTLETLGTNGSSISGTANSTTIKPVDFTSFGKLSDFPSPNGLTVYGQIGKYANVFLTALDNTKKFHVIQKPTICVINHKKGVISTGQQIAIPGQTYTTGATGTTNAGIYSTTTYVPVELRLEVIPHIYSNGELKLEFSQSNSDVSGFTTISGNQVPNLTHQSLENTIVIPNGSTVLLGGLITERDTKNTSGIPLLVKIPLLKYLFGNTTKNKERDELLVLIQPRIVNSGTEFEDKQMEIERQAESYKRDRDFADEHTTGSSPPPDLRSDQLIKAQTTPQEILTKRDLSGRFQPATGTK